MIVVHERVRTDAQFMESILFIKILSSCTLVHSNLYDTKEDI